MFPNPGPVERPAKSSTCPEVRPSHPQVSQQLVAHRVVDINAPHYSPFAELTTAREGDVRARVRIDERRPRPLRLTVRRPLVP